MIQQFTDYNLGPGREQYQIPLFGPHLYRSLLIIKKLHTYLRVITIGQNKLSGHLRHQIRGRFSVSPRKSHLSWRNLILFLFFLPWAKTYYPNDQAFPVLVEVCISGKNPYSFQRIHREFFPETKKRDAILSNHHRQSDGKTFINVCNQNLLKYGLNK